MIALHPAVLARYEQQLVRLQDALAAGLRSGSTEGAEAIRDFVETVTVSRDPSKLGGVQVEIAGRLNALLGEKAYPNGVRGVWEKMVAEARFGRYSRTQPVEIVDLGLWRGFGAPNEVAQRAA